MNGLAQEALPLIGYAAACLLLAAIFMTLYGSYRVTQEAGLDRLAEKFPALRGRFRKLDKQWDLLRAAMLLCAASFLVLALALLLAALHPSLDLKAPHALLALFLFALLATFFVQILPHALSESYADRFSVRFLPFASALSKLLRPLVWPLAQLERRLVKRLLSEADTEARPSHEDEILSLVENASETEMEEEERELIKSVFEFGETIVREIMTPRVDIVGLPEALTVAECCAEVHKTPHNRFPVYSESFDKIRGLVDVKQLLALLTEDKGAQPVGDFARPMLAVSETTAINEVLRLLRANRDHVALVTDEFGGTEGLVSIQDIVEELIGDLHPEHQDEFILQRIDDNVLILDAGAPVDELNEALDIDIPEDDDYDTLGGFIFHTLGRIPRPGESLDLRDCRLTVQSGSARRLYGIQLHKKMPGAPSDS